MAITVTPTATGSEFDLGALGKLTVGTEDDAGTDRVVARLDGARVQDWTPAGGHIEFRDLDTPANYERL